MADEFPDLLYPFCLGLQLLDFFVLCLYPQFQVADSKLQVGVVGLELGIVFLLQLPDLLGDVLGFVVTKEFSSSLKDQLHLVVAALHLVWEHYSLVFKKLIEK